MPLAVVHAESHRDSLFPGVAPSTGEPRAGELKLESIGSGEPERSSNDRERSVAMGVAGGSAESPCS